MFEKATRLKLRFNYKGSCTIEDLWDISLNGTKQTDNEDKGLKGIYQELRKELKSYQEMRLLNEDSLYEENLESAKKSQEEELLELKKNIIKYIFKTKFQEQKNRENKTLKANEKQEVLKIIAEKQNDILRNKSIEELTEIANKS